MDRTVLTEVCTMTGERCSTAAASTASSVRALTTLIAATPYRSLNARSRICFKGTTGTTANLRSPAAGRISVTTHLQGGLPLPGALPEPGLAGQRGQFGAVAGPGLAQHGPGVLLHGPDRQDQLLGDELVRQPLLHQAAHLPLALGQGRLGLVVLQPAVEPLQDRAGQDGLAAAGRDDGPDQFRPVRPGVHA